MIGSVAIEADHVYYLDKYRDCRCMYDNAKIVNMQDQLNLYMSMGTCIWVAY